MMISKGILLALLCLATTKVYGQNLVDVAVQKVISNKDYPGFASSSDKWLIANKQLGGAVLLECDIRFKTKADCTLASLKFNDGERSNVICTNTTKYKMHSKYNSLEVELKLKKGGISFKCNSTAMEYGRPENEKETTNEENMESVKVLKKIDGDIKVAVKVINTDIDGNLTSHMTRKYIFRSEKNLSVRLTCHMTPHVASNPERRCDGFRLRVDGGSRVKWQCQTDSFFNFISEKDKLVVTITTGDKVSGYVKCNVDAVKEVKHSNYKKVASEEIDSSEFGLKQKTGTKKTTCDCGWANKQTRRIIFGKDTGKHEFPWSVSLQYKSSKFHFCGGSIISPYHVLTAAHCIGSKKPAHILVVMGTNDRTNNKISSEVKAIFEHYYNRKSHVNDIAILELITKVEYTPFVGPVCLPTKDPQIAGQYVTAMGWGRLHKTEQATKDARIMKKTNLRVIDVDSCSIDWNFHWETDVRRVICTWSNHTDICIGDSGGPVTWHDSEINRYTLVGLPALCDGCVLRLPSAHTAVHYFYDWIQETIKKSSQPDAMTCSKID
uniref:Venom S1 protease 8 n=1 Tax=Platymeris rhadamanthus TaxID=1134088 RepID=A0A6B9L3Z0_PLARH|nr:venom S1 protease 8 [Platymeris rhadamanthus]